MEMERKGILNNVQNVNIEYTKSALELKEGLPAYMVLSVKDA